MSENRTNYTRIKDVAKTAGVTTATVSTFINKTKFVSGRNNIIGVPIVGLGTIYRVGRTDEDTPLCSAGFARFYKKAKTAAANK